MRYSKFDIAVVTVFVCLLLVALAWLGHHIGENARRGMVGSVEFSLKEIFTQASEITMKAHGLTNQSAIESLTIEPATLSRLQFYRADGDSRILPSFVAKSNVFLATESTQVPSHDILCVMQMPDSSLYGIDGAGICSTLSSGQFNNWHHRMLADDHSKNSP